MQCFVLIGALVAFAAALFVVTTWPAYFLGLLRLSPRTVARIERGVVMATATLLLGATGSILFLALHGC